MNYVFIEWTHCDLSIGSSRARGRVVYGHRAQYISERGQLRCYSHGGLSGLAISTLTQRLDIVGKCLKKITPKTYKVGSLSSFQTMGVSEKTVVEHLAHVQMLTLQPSQTKRKPKLLCRWKPE